MQMRLFPISIPLYLLRTTDLQVQKVLLKKKRVIVEMFWKLFKIHTLYDPFMDVNHSGPGPDGVAVRRKDPQPLDPIENPGRLKSKEMAKAMKRQKVHFAIDAHRILTEEKYAQERILRQDLQPDDHKKARKVVSSNSIFANIIVTLCLWGVMSDKWEDKSTEPPQWLPFRQENITTYAKYFQVPKTKNSDRAIADSRRAGAITDVPPPINLPHIQHVLSEVAKLGTTQCVVGDFRHFFYQHGITQWLSTLFGIKCGELVARMVVLPMGWSWSPRLAQCSGWSILLHRGENQPALGVNETWGDDPPTMVKLRDENKEVVGLIFLWIDNFIVFHKQQHMRDKWADRIKQNCAKFDVRIKEIESTQTPKYLGIYFEMKAGVVVWRHELDRTKKWQESVNKEIRTPRDIATLVGIGIWHYTVALQPLLKMKDSIDAMRAWRPWGHPL